ncbi:MAG: M20 family metallo-hydrolase [Spirochaetaceae bacterium]|jgi:succinyl-diaminopimelate desuccinylase|nr:M20 family metallo-hydrolase [Spirochaetaceae bacterium]
MKPNLDSIFNTIDSFADRAIELERELCKRPAVSPGSGGEGELDKCLFLEGWLKAQGISTIQRFDAPDPSAKGGVRPNLIATIEGENDAANENGRLWIISHLDVVPPGEAKLWDSNPWELQTETEDSGQGPRTKLIGRGVEDNQQGLVSSVLAALALLKTGTKPARTIKLLFAADEEMGSEYGVIYLVKNHPELFAKNDVALIPDSGDPQGASIEIAEKNTLWLQFTTIGKQAHASTPDQGNNAFIAGSDLALRLHRGLSAKFNAHDSLFEPDYSSFQPTKKLANVPNINTIPGEDVFFMDNRILPCYKNTDILAEVHSITATVEKDYAVQVRVEGIQSAESPATREDAPIIGAIKKAVQQVYAVDAKCIGIGGGTIAAILRKIGMDAAVWCRIAECAHQPNEYAYLNNILGDAKVMASLML